MVRASLTPSAASSQSRLALSSPWKRTNDRMAPPIHLCCSKALAERVCELIRDDSRGQHGSAKETCTNCSFPHQLCCIVLKFISIATSSCCSPSFFWFLLFSESYQELSKAGYKGDTSCVRRKALSRGSEAEGQEQPYPEEVSCDVVGECIPSGTDVLLQEDMERETK